MKNSENPRVSFLCTFCEHYNRDIWNFFGEGGWGCIVRFSGQNLIFFLEEDVQEETNLQKITYMLYKKFNVHIQYTTHNINVRS